MKLQKNMNKIIVFTFSVLLLLLYVFPFFIVLINSFKGRLEIIKNPLSFPENLAFENFISAYETMNFGKVFLNSLIVTVLSVTIIIFFSSMLAYYLVRWKSKFSNSVFMSLVISMIIPFQCLMIPFVTIYGKMNLLNNKYMLVFFYLGFGVSLATFLFHGFIKAIPFELEEAAIIDGASQYQTFFKIIFPMLKPTITTVAILDVLWVWNDFLLPSLVLVDENARTIPLSTFYFFGKYTAEYNTAMAALILSLIPVIVFYLVMQKQIIKGITDGAIK